MAAKFDKFLGKIREWSSKASDISDSGAAGRDLLRMGTLAEIQSSVSGGAAVAVSAAKTLSSGDRACLQLAAGNPVFTVPGGMPAGWYVPIDGACMFAQGAGTPVILDKREAIAAYPFCVISVTPSGYILVGSKA